MNSEISPTAPAASSATVDESRLRMLWREYADRRGAVVARQEETAQRRAAEAKAKRDTMLRLAAACVVAAVGVALMGRA